MIWYILCTLLCTYKSIQHVVKDYTMGKLMHLTEIFTYKKHDKLYHAHFFGSKCLHPLHDPTYTSGVFTYTGQ